MKHYKLVVFYKIGKSKAIHQESRTMAVEEGYTLSLKELKRLAKQGAFESIRKQGFSPIHFVFTEIEMTELAQ